MAINRKFDPTSDIGFRRPEPKEIIQKTAEVTENSQNPVKEPKKAGRPKIYTETRKRINIYLSEDIIEKTDIFKYMLPGGRSEYIEKLILKDLNENYERYMDTYKMIQMI